MYTVLVLLLNYTCVDIFAIIGRGLYGEVDPDRFGNLARACFTLFQLITLDDWFYMYSDIRDNYPGVHVGRATTLQETYSGLLHHSTSERMLSCLDIPLTLTL